MRIISVMSCLQKLHLQLRFPQQAPTLRYVEVYINFVCTPGDLRMLLCRKQISIFRITPPVPAAVFDPTTVWWLCHSRPSTSLAWSIKRGRAYSKHHGKQLLRLFKADILNKSVRLVWFAKKVWRRTDAYGQSLRHHHDGHAPVLCETGRVFRHLVHCGMYITW